MMTSEQAEATPRHRMMQDAGLHRKVQQWRTVLFAADIEQPDDSLHRMRYLSMLRVYAPTGCGCSTAKGMQHLNAGSECLMKPGGHCCTGTQYGMSGPA